MPQIRLAENYKGHKAGEIVSVDGDEYVAALDANVVGKTYREKVPGVRAVRLTPAASTSDRPVQESLKPTTAAKKAAAKK